MIGRRSAILDAGISVLAGPILVLSVYLLVAGHNLPGGGFAAGLVAGVALTLAWSAGGTTLVRRLVPVRASALLGAGVTLAGLTGLAPLFTGGDLLQSGSVTIDLPLFGSVKLVSALLFDAGVYLVVIGLTVAVVRGLGETTEDRL